MRAFVTAGAAGIGRAIAERLAKDGARLALTDVDDAALASAAKALPEALCRKADVTDDSAMADVVAAAVAQFGGLDVLVNNAGIAGPTGAVDEISPDDWRRCIDVTLTGQFIAARHAVPQLKAAGGGAIVNISSAAGRHGYAYRTPYSAAKFGVVGFTEALAKELGPHGIRVNAILPGIVEGPRIEGVIEARAKQLGISRDAMAERMLANVSLRRMVSAAEVADMAAYLVSPAGAGVSGQSIGVDGNVETL